MKRKITLLFLLLALACGATYSQDVVIFKDGEEVLAKVLEITPDLVKYKLFSNLDGPIISVERPKVFMIKYENGSKQVLDEKEAQPRDPDPKPADNQNTDGPTVTYSRVRYERKRVDSEIYNLIKLNPLAILNGDLPIYYERRLGEQVSAEVGIGFTYAYDLGEEIWGYDYSYEGRDPRPGYSLRAGLHFFPNKSVAAPEEWYFGPEVMWRHYATTLTTCSGFTPVEGIDESRNLLDLKVNAGYILFVADAVLFDFYAGLGMRRRDVFWATCDYSGPFTVIQQPTHDVNWRPVLSVGVKFGFGF